MHKEIDLGIVGKYCLYRQTCHLPYILAQNRAILHKRKGFLSCGQNYGNYSNKYNKKLGTPGETQKSNAPGLNPKRCAHTNRIRYVCPKTTNPMQR
jgi:hypothetical protein